MTSYLQKRLELLGEKVIDETKCCHAFVEKLKEGQPLTETDKVKMGKLKVAMTRLMTEIQKYTHQHQGPSSPHMEELIGELTSAHMRADDILVELDVDMGTTEQHDRHPTDSISSGSANITSRLPKLDLPKFDGNVLNWHEFWSKFTASIDGRVNLNDVDKLTYLQIAVSEGNAKELIAGLASTDEAYKIAVTTLMEEYGEEGIVIDAHYTALFNVPKANQEIRDNKRVLSEVDRHLRILDALGEKTGQNNALRAMLVSKFSSNVQSNLRMKLRPTQETVANIIASLKIIIRALEHHSAPTQNTPQIHLSGTGFTTEALYSQYSENDRNKSNRNQKRNWYHQEQNSNKRPRTDKFPKNPVASTSGINSNRSKNSTNTISQKSFIGHSGNNDKRFPQRPQCIFCQGSHTHESCRRYKTVKDRKAKLSGRWFICLRANHNAQNCQSKEVFCTHCGAKGHHNRCLCPIKYGSEDTITNFAQIGLDTVLQTTLISFRSEMLKAKVLFDCGSQKSYIHCSLAKQPKLSPLEKTNLTVFTFGSNKPKSIPADLVTLPIKLSDSVVDLMAYVVPSTTGFLPSHNEIKSILYKKFSDVDWAEDSKEDRFADIIIGNDFYYKFITAERKEIANNLYMIKTVFGWIPSGSFTHNDRRADQQLSVLTYVEGSCVCGHEDLFIRPDPAVRNDDIKALWELETIGITDPPKLVHDEDVVEYFNKTTQFVEGRYYVKWPWAEFPPNITPNLGLALGRLQSLLKRLDSAQRQRYDDVLMDQLERGIIEVIPENGLPKTHPVHYLPHHCVIQEHKSTKLRIVYDASSKVKGQCSLNELLYKGPLMLEDLTTLVLKFRTHSIGLVADIEKAFLQIGLQDEDRDGTRFLWVKDINHAPSNDNLIHLRFCRVPFGIISSPFLLAATIRHHILSKDQIYARRLASCLYVDNLITGVETPTEAKDLYHTAVQALDELSMNLRGWNSNDKSLLGTFRNSHRDTDNIISVLGLTWDTVNDHLKLAFSTSKLDRPVNTKREVLSIIASVFDPCGFVAPLTLPTRIFLQTLWAKGLKWDTPLTPEQRIAWDKCVGYLKRIPHFYTPRRFIESNNFEQATLDMHCFTDASQDAYVAVVYVRTNHGTSYVISKSRVTPLQRKTTLTIPKLELLAVVIGTRLLSHVRKILDLPSIKTYLWTDSQAVLGWLHTKRLLPPWVSRQVGEIHETPNVCFHFVPSGLNPADVATRPLQQETIPDCWLDGPKFLRQPYHQWPTQQQHTAAESTIDEAETEPLNRSVFDGTTQVLNVTKEAIDWNLPSRGTTLPLPAILHLQHIHFEDEVAGKTTRFSKNLGVFRDDHGVLRCKGRYKNATLSYDQRCPILLPKESDLTSWVIRRVHIENYHVGTSHTLSIVRHQYWIPQGRSAVSKLLKRCPECIKYGGGPFRLPDMPDLPQERLSYSPPFTYTGLDYLGPLVVNENDIKHKRWVCLFTCMAVRAVHLEVVADMSAAEFVLCLRRFVASRGTPKLILSDNASQFTLVSTVLASPNTTTQQIDWRFITELSPWQGGLYERLVGLVKHCIHRTVDKALLSDVQLQTIIKEVEAVLNTRPLTTVGPEHETILTPSHFLRTCGPPDLQPPDQESDRFPTDIQRQVVEGWKRTTNLLNHFRDMFTNQYLLSLRERHTPTHKQPRVLSYRKPCVGDIVQVKGDTHNRALWKVGRITVLRSGLDGQVRSAQVKLDTDVVINRSIGHLYPLELDLRSDQPNIPADTTSYASGDHPVSPDNTLRQSAASSTTDNSSSATADPTPPLTSGRPQRTSAHRARQRIRQWTTNLFSLATSSLLKK